MLLIRVLLIVVWELMFASCINQDKHYNNFSDNEETMKNSIINKADTNLLSNQLDSIRVSCLFLGKSSKSIVFIFGGNGFKWLNNHKDNNVHYINSIEDRNKFVNYINLFYIDCTEEIVLEKKKRQYIVSTDYPDVVTEGYKDGKKIIYNRTQIGEEEYDVEYNPKFLEFYKFLDCLVVE